MFGLSLGKLLLTAAVIAIIWYGYKWIGRLQARQGGGRRVRWAARPAERPPEKRPADEDMVQCPVCGDYVAPRSAVECRRDGCPYPE